MASLVENFSNQSLDLKTLPKFEEVNYKPISGKYLWKVNLQTGIFLLVVLGIWGVMLFQGIPALYLWLSLGIIVVFFGFNFWNNYKLQQNYGYALRQKDILYRRGFLVNSVTVIPFNRVQHASVSRDILDKFFDLSSVQVYTAGGSGSDISIPGLQPEVARQLKEALAVKLSEDEI